MRMTPLFLLTISTLIGLCACRRDLDPGRLATSPDVLVYAAHDTYARYVRAVNAGDEVRSDVIPDRYWADAIRALKPIKVYTHRANIVVAQRVREHLEEGKYICIPISSLLPQEGVDGFSFTPDPQTDGAHQLANGVFDYRRSIQ